MINSSSFTDILAQDIIQPQAPRIARVATLVATNVIRIKTALFQPDSVSIPPLLQILDFMRHSTLRTLATLQVIQVALLRGPVSHLQYHPCKMQQRRICINSII